MANRSRNRLVTLALAGVAVGAAYAHSLPVLSLVGAVAAVVGTHNRMKRRAAKAHLWGSLAATVWIVLVALAHADRRFEFAAPVVGAAVVYALNWSKRRRGHAPTSGAVRSGRL